MPSRRSFLTLALSFAASLPFAGRIGGARIQRSGKFFLVNGWILTAEDVRALDDHAL